MASPTTTDDLWAHHSDRPWPAQPRVQDLTTNMELRTSQRVIFPELNIPVGEVFYGRDKTLTFSVRVNALISARLAKQWQDLTDLKLIGGLPYRVHKARWQWRRLMKNLDPTLDAIKLGFNKKRLDSMANIHFSECVLELKKDIFWHMPDGEVLIEAPAAAEMLESAVVWIDENHWVLSSFTDLSCVPEEWIVHDPRQSGRPPSRSQSQTASFSCGSVRQRTPLREASTRAADANFEKGESLGNFDEEEGLGEEECNDEFLRTHQSVDPAFDLPETGEGTPAIDFGAEHEEACSATEKSEGEGIYSREEASDIDILLPHIANGRWIWITKITPVPSTKVTTVPKKTEIIVPKKSIANQGQETAKFLVEINADLMIQLHNARLAFFSLRPKDPKEALISFCKNGFVPSNSLIGMFNRTSLWFLHFPNNTELFETQRKQLPYAMAKYWAVHSQSFDELGKMLETQTAAPTSSLFSPFKKPSEPKIDQEVLRIARRCLEIEAEELVTWLAKDKCSIDCSLQSEQYRIQCPIVARRTVVVAKVRKAVFAYVKERSRHHPSCHSCFWEGFGPVCAVHVESDSKAKVPVCDRCYLLAVREFKMRKENERKAREEPHPRQMIIEILHWDQNHQSKPRPEKWCCHRGEICIEGCKGKCDSECDKGCKGKDKCKDKHTLKCEGNCIPKFRTLGETRGQEWHMQENPTYRRIVTYVEERPTDNFSQTDSGISGVSKKSNGSWSRRKHRIRKRLGKIVRRPSWFGRRRRGVNMPPEEADIQNTPHALVDVNQQLEALST